MTDAVAGSTARTAFHRMVRPLRPWLVRAAHAFVLARLRIEAWFASVGGARRPVRIAATACWQFPIYSQTFVHQEVVALAQAGFSVRFFYGHLGPRAELAEACRALWPLRRRVVINETTGALDYQYFRRRMPARVEAVTRLIATAAGLRPEDLERQEHFLHAFSFARAVAAWRADYLHSYFFYERTLYALVASQLLDIPRGVSCYADHLLQDYPLKLVPLHLRTCDLVVATSQRIRNELEALHGAPLETTVVKPNGIDTSRFPVKYARVRRAGEPLTLVCVSRVDPKKGIEYLIDAVRLLRDRGQRIEAHIVGAPDMHSKTAEDYERALRARAMQNGLDGIVSFHGKRNSREVRAFLERTDVFVAPFVELPNGDKDGIPTALLEAMATGCAIVASTAGSIGEVIEDGKEGLLVAQRDAEALADAVERLAAHPELAASMAARAADRVRREFDVASSERPFHSRVRRVTDRRRAMSPAPQAAS